MRILVRKSNFDFANKKNLLNLYYLQFFIKVTLSYGDALVAKNIEMKVSGEILNV